jgi:hypothetical protein
MKNPKNKIKKTIYFNCSECGNKKPCVNPPIVFDEQRNELFCNNTGIVFSKEEFKKRIIKDPKKRNINLY